MDTIPVNQVDWPNFNPDIDVIQLDGVTATGKRPNWFVRTARRIGRAIADGGDGEIIPGGLNLVKSGKAIDPTRTTSKNHVETINIDLLLQALGFPSAGRFNRSPLDGAKGLKSVTDAALNNTGKITPDRDIVNNHTGPVQTDANGRPIENVISPGGESKSIAKMYDHFNEDSTKIYRIVQGDTIATFKKHNGTFWIE